MTSIWLTAGMTMLAAASLVLAWAALRLAREVVATRGASEQLTRRFDALSLRVRQLETTRTRFESSWRPRRNMRVDAGSPATASGPTLIAVPSLASSGSEATAAAAADELARRFGAIWELADGGRSITDIARETGHPVGQVELILGLRRSRATGISAAESVPRWPQP